MYLYSFLVDFGIERFDLVHMEGYLVDQGNSYTGSGGIEKTI